MNCPKTLFPVIATLVAGCAVAAPPPMEESFVAATYNIRVDCDPSPNTWAERVPRCREIVRRNRFDIFGLQEALDHQVKSLLSGTEYAMIGGGRDDFKCAGEYCCIVYRKDRFECLKSGTFGLSEAPDKPGLRSWKSEWPRIATWGLFRDRRTGKEFVYYNTHLDNGSELARCKGIELLVAHARKHAAGKPIMISGDFNAVPDSPTCRTARKLLNDSAAVSETPHSGPGYSYQNWGRETLESTPPIDFIFVSDDFRVLSHRTDGTLIDGKYPSDHFPVIAELVLK